MLLTTNIYAQTRVFSVTLKSGCSILDRTNETFAEVNQAKKEYESFDRCVFILKGRAKKFEYCAITGLMLVTSGSYAGCHSAKEDDGYVFVLDVWGVKDKGKKMLEPPMSCWFTCILKK